MKWSKMAAAIIAAGVVIKTLRHEYGGWAMLAAYGDEEYEFALFGNDGADGADIGTIVFPFPDPRDAAEGADGVKAILAHFGLDADGSEL